MPIGSTRFLGDRFGASPVLLASSFTPLRSFADAGEFFQADQGVGVGHDNGFRDGVINLQFQPSLSSAERNLSPCCGASAFFLQAFTEPGVVVSTRPDAFSRIEPALVGKRSSRCQVALPDIYADNSGKRFRGWLRHLQFQGDQLLKLFVGFVIPELGTSNGGTMMDQGHMRLIALIRHNNTTL